MSDRIIVFANELLRDAETARIAKETTDHLIERFAIEARKHDLVDQCDTILHDLDIDKINGLRALAGNVIDLIQETGIEVADLLDHFVDTNRYNSLKSAITALQNGFRSNTIDHCISLLESLIDYEADMQDVI